jgi:uncharacterized heparinase superfamily protein
VTGRDRHHLASRLHLSPGITLQRRSSSAIVLERDGKSIEVSTPDSRIQVDKGWYCPQFGKRKSRSVLLIDKSSCLPARSEVVIDY